MALDPYTAVWVSHTSISDFLACPRSYFLKNVYKDPKTGNKIQVMSPPLALGQAVHEVLENLSVVPTDKRFDTPLIEKFEESWKRVAGKKGGFWDKDTEHRYKQRGIDMIKRVQAHPGVLAKKAVKINMDLPHFWLSEEEEIILCGKIDWLEYNEENDSVHIVDFKTGKSRQTQESLQLPIYMLLVNECQKREVEAISYWYLESADEPETQPLPDPDQSRKKVLDIARRVKVARKLEKFDCPHNGCSNCAQYEAVLRGEGEHVGVNAFRQDVYIVKPKAKLSDSEEDSRIL
ncbi:MAG: RecB family exonuclease [Patescibacteria group bacterium]